MSLSEPEARSWSELTWSVHAELFSPENPIVCDALLLLNTKLRDHITDVPPVPRSVKLDFLE